MFSCIMDCSDLARHMPVALSLLVVAIIVVTFVVRQKALGVPVDTQRLHPFKAEDAVRLRAWAARMQRLFRLTMIALAFSFGVSLLEARGSTRGACWIAYPLLLIFLTASIAVQFSIRCPVCDYRLGLQSRLRAPDHCERCDTAFVMPD